MLACVTAKQQPIDASKPYVTEKVWRSTDLSNRDSVTGWKEFRFLVIHNPTNKIISTRLECETFISEIVVQPNSSVDVLLSDDDLKCETK